MHSKKRFFTPTGQRVGKRNENVRLNWKYE